MSSQNDYSEVTSALAQIAAEGERFSRGEDGARERLVASARDLIFAAEEPLDTLLWHMWGEVRQRCVRIRSLRIVIASIANFTRQR